MCFLLVLKFPQLHSKIFFFDLKCINYFKREEFLDFIPFGDVVQCGFERQFIRNILFLDAIFTHGITNCENILLAKHCIFSCHTPSLDQTKLFSINRTRLIFCSGCCSAIHQLLNLSQSALLKVALHLSDLQIFALGSTSLFEKISICCSFQIDINGFKRWTIPFQRV